MEGPQAVQFEIARHLRSLRDLARLCKTNRQWGRICALPRFWVGLFDNAVALQRFDLAAEIAARLFAFSPEEQQRDIPQATREAAGAVALRHLPLLWARGISWESPIIQAAVELLPPQGFLVGYRGSGGASAWSEGMADARDGVRPDGHWNTSPLVVGQHIRIDDAANRYWVAYRPVAEGRPMVQLHGGPTFMGVGRGLHAFVDMWYAEWGADQGVYLQLNDVPRARRSPERRSPSPPRHRRARHGP